jgi:hypothetical protein
MKSAAAPYNFRRGVTRLNQAKPKPPSPDRYVDAEVRMLIQGSLLKWCETKLTELREELAPLESGELRTGKRLRDGDWQDTTEVEITRLQSQMRAVETLIGQRSSVLRVVK